MKFHRSLVCFSIISLCLLVNRESLTEAAPAMDPRLAPQFKIPLQISSVTLNPTSVTGGTTQVLGTVTLNQPAPSGGVAVTLGSSHPTVAAVPQGVVVQPGAATATFVAQTQPVSINPNVVTAPPSVQISAQIGNAAPKIAQLTVLPPTLISLTLNPTSLPGGNGSTGTVTISGPAPSGGMVVTLSSKATTPSPTPRLDPSILRQTAVSATVPPQITIAAGTTSGTFPVTTRPVSTSTPIQITAAWGVFTAKTATLTLLPPSLASLFPSPAPGTGIGVTGGMTLTGKVTLTGPTPSEGITVQIQIPGGGGPTSCVPTPQAPATVRVVGDTSATFPITTFSVSRVTDFAITATYDKTISGKFTVYPPTPVSLTFSPRSVKGGSTVQGIIALPGPVLPYSCNNNVPYKVNLSLVSSGDTPYVQFPPQVGIDAGKTQAIFNITTSAVPSTKQVTISARSAGGGGGTVGTLTIVP